MFATDPLESSATSYLARKKMEVEALKDEAAFQEKHMIDKESLRLHHRLASIESRAVGDGLTTHVYHKGVDGDDLWTNLTRPSLGQASNCSSNSSRPTSAPMVIQVQARASAPVWSSLSSADRDRFGVDLADSNDLAVGNRTHVGSKSSYASPCDASGCFQQENGRYLTPTKVRNEAASFDNSYSPEKESRSPHQLIRLQACSTPPSYSTLSPEDRKRFGLPSSDPGTNWEQWEAPHQRDRKPLFDPTLPASVAKSCEAYHPKYNGLSPHIRQQAAPQILQTGSLSLEDRARFGLDTVDTKVKPEDAENFDAIGERLCRNELRARLGMDPSIWRGTKVQAPSMSKTMQQLDESIGKVMCLTELRAVDRRYQSSLHY